MFCCRKNSVRYLIFAFCFFSSCTKMGVVEKGIFSMSYKCKVESKIGCNFKLSDITPFEWDTLYLFHQETSPIMIGEVLKISYSKNSVPQGKTRMIFTLKGRVIHEEDYSWEKFTNRVLDFIDLPVDTTSAQTQDGCFTRVLPYVSKEDAKYTLVNQRNNQSQNFLFFKKHEIVIKLFLSGSNDCYEVK